MVHYTHIDGAQNKCLQFGFKSGPLYFSFPTIYPHHRPHILTGKECVTLERVEMISEAFLEEEGCFRMAVWRREGSERKVQVTISLPFIFMHGNNSRWVNTLRTGDADLRSYITTVQDG